MSKQKEIVLYAICFPISRSLTVVLLFDYYFLELKACKLKHRHSFKRKGLHHAFFASITEFYSKSAICFKVKMC